MRKVALKPLCRLGYKHDPITSGGELRNLSQLNYSCQIALCPVF